MLQRKNIVGYLLILLLVLSGNNEVCYSCARQSNTPDGAQHLSAAANNSSNEVSVFHPSIKKDRIKVRYMGGECGYDVALIPVVIAAAVFPDKVKGADYVSFISSHHHFLFKLRGPPLAFS